MSAPLFAAGGFLPPTSSPVTSDTAKGNLVEPLSWLQIFGVWPEGDFRFEPGDMTVTYLLDRTVALAAAIGLVLAWRGGSTGLLLFVAGTAAAAPSSWRSARPGSTRRRWRRPRPALVFAALAGAGLLADGRRRIAGTVVAVAGRGGVLWSNVLAYHEVNLAPYDRHASSSRSAT